MVGDYLSSVSFISKLAILLANETGLAREAFSYFETTWTGHIFCGILYSYMSQEQEKGQRNKTKQKTPNKPPNAFALPFLSFSLSVSQSFPREKEKILYYWFLVLRTKLSQRCCMVTVFRIFKI